MFLPTDVWHTGFAGDCAAGAGDEGEIAAATGLVLLLRCVVVLLLFALLLECVPAVCVVRCVDRL